MTAGKTAPSLAVNPRIVLFSESGATTTFGDKYTHFHNHTPYPLSSYKVAQRQSGGGFFQNFFAPQAASSTLALVAN